MCRASTTFTKQLATFLDIALSSKCWYHCHQGIFIFLGKYYSSLQCQSKRTKTTIHRIANPDDETNPTPIKNIPNKKRKKKLEQKQLKIDILPVNEWNLPITHPLHIVFLHSLQTSPKTFSPPYLLRIRVPYFLNYSILPIYIYYIIANSFSFVGCSNISFSRIPFAIQEIQVSLLSSSSSQRIVSREMSRFNGLYLSNKIGRVYRAF